MSLPPPGVHAHVDDQGAMKTCTISALSKVEMVRLTLYKNVFDQLSIARKQPDIIL